MEKKKNNEQEFTKQQTFKSLNDSEENSVTNFSFGNLSATFFKNPKTLILNKMLHIPGPQLPKVYCNVLCYKIFKVSSGSKIICYIVSLEGRL